MSLLADSKKNPTTDVRDVICSYLFSLSLHSQVAGLYLLDNTVGTFQEYITFWKIINIASINSITNTFKILGSRSLDPGAYLSDPLISTILIFSLRTISFSSLFILIFGYLWDVFCVFFPEDRHRNILITAISFLFLNIIYPV